MFFKELILLFFYFVTVNSFAQEYSFRNLKTFDGPARQYVYSIVQDQRGFLWIGTADGLANYNGFAFNSFSAADSLADNFISSGIDDGKYLWFGHRNGSITFYDGRSFHPVRYNGRKLSSITDFSKSPDGSVWVSSLSDGLFKLENGKIIFESNLYGEQQPVYSFAFLTDNEILIGTGSGLFHLKKGDRPGEEKVVPVNEIPAARVSFVKKMKHGPGFLIATENDGIYEITYDRQALKVNRIIPDLPFDFTGVQSLCDDIQGNIWVGSFRNGLIKLAPASGQKKKVILLNPASGFITQDVKLVFEDREGNIWTGNYGDGITLVTPRLFSVYTFDKNKYGTEVFSISAGEGGWWIGTGKGLIYADRNSGEVIKFFGPESGLPQDTITAIYRSPGNDLWIGTFKKGLFRKSIENSRFNKFSIAEGVLENSITAITGKNDQVWVGTKKGLYSINPVTGIIDSYSINRGGLPHNSINCLYIDRKGLLWVTTNSSIISNILDGKVSKIPLSSGSGILTLGPVAEDSASRIWTGSKGNGVFLIAEDSIQYLSTKEGLLSDFCYSIIYDNNQNIWIGHKNGISRVRTSDFSIKQIERIEGLPGDFQINANAAVIDQSGNLILGTNRGLITYDQKMESPLNVAPVLGITSVRINNEERDAEGGRIILSPGTYRIKIEYFGTSLKEPGLTKYQHKLENYDDWSEITKETSVTYPHLSDGEYTFILKASSGDGSVTEKPLELKILIRKPLWKMWWFYPLALLILSAIVVLYIKWRLKRLIAEKKILEEKVVERTKEIMAQKNEIELQRDLIERKNSNITSSITYARKIQTAVLPPPELIDSLIPDNFVFHLPKDIVSGDFFWLTEKDNKIIIAVADCTGHGVPGAFMSLLGITLLNEIVNIQSVTRSDEIVTILRERVVQSLQQSRKDSITMDGMDIALCVLDKNLKKLQFTGAMNDLFYVSEGKRNVIRSDHMDVSPADYNLKRFKLNEIEYMAGDMIYLFTDGYQDQFGGEFDKKFLRPHFYNTLFEMSSLPPARQKVALETKLNEWMNGRSQTDDITVIGIRL